ncbi:MAG: hypothetical protein J5525_12840 [Lachnospiraceae bacterium]|nr:hypothetical protein [Lachnospiraceae bacterium]
MNYLEENLTNEEAKRFKDLVDEKVFEGIAEHELWRALPVNRSNDPNLPTLTELSGENEELAMLILTSIERAEGVEKNSFIEEFIFDNKDEREDKLQRAMIPGLIKNIRSKSGLSQRRFAEKYDVNIKSLEAWESGQKKISKYTYLYLKGLIGSELKCVSMDKKFTLPLDILKIDSLDFLKECIWQNDVIFVRHIEECLWEKESYVIKIDNSEYIEDGEIVREWETADCPEDIRACIKAAIDCGCNILSFDAECEYKSDIYERLESWIQAL